MSHTRKHQPTPDQTKPEDLTQFVMNENNSLKWRGIPNDPYIYISFSAEQLKQTYGLPRDDHEGIADINNDLENHYKNLITKWLEQTGLDHVKFLPSHITRAEILNKNVCFISSTNLTRNQYIQKFESLGVMHTLTIGQTGCSKPCAKAKIIRTPNLSLTDFNNMIEYSFKHEVMGHAILEEKHFVKHSPEDPGPFKKMTCKESIMAYEDSCPPVVSKITQHLLLPDGTLPAENDPNPRVQNAWHEAYQAYPKEFGSVDLLVAKKIKENWKARNKIERQDAGQTSDASIKNNQQKKVNDNHHEELIAPSYQRIKNTLTQRLISSASPNYSQSVSKEMQEFIDNLPNFHHKNSNTGLLESLASSVADCSCYFPKDNLNYWNGNNSSLLFRNSTKLPQGTVPRLAPTLTR